MAARPPQIRYLTGGKALGAAINKGFAATWNWLLAWVNFFKAGKGLKLNGTCSGHPRLDVEILSGEGIDVSCGGAGQPYVISLLEQGSKVVFTGTDSSESSPSCAFTFASASDSNVEVTASGTTITIGVYWT